MVEQAHIYLTEQEMTEILKDLHSDNPLRPYLQKAGENIFGW